MIKGALTSLNFKKHSYEKMNELFISIRNCFLGKNTTPLARRILLEMIEGSVFKGSESAN